ncbi:MAG: hypothetical protein K8R02_04970 [Anaerohalosphaeraceae bacterium]|nr:hypothetical protein [Anaerohalosphaeraceae bacterium]
MRNLMVLAVLGCVVLMAVPASYAAPIYQTDFEDFTPGDVNGQDATGSDPNGWVELTKDVNGLPSSGDILDMNDQAGRWIIDGNKTLAVYRKNGVTADAVVTRYFPGATLLDISFDAGDCHVGKSGYFRIRDDSNHTGPRVGFHSSGFICAYDGQTRVNFDAYVDWDDLIDPCDPNSGHKSYHFRIVADANVSNRTYDFYVDGVQEANDFSFYNSTSSRLSELRIERGTSNKLLVDNLVISTEMQCGDWGYSSSDINEDCYVDFKDFAILAGEWLDCTDPNNSSCFD